ncbi:MAG: 30S ribosomal protein S6 [Planctomycetota bacterium]|nr:30S ribosomal protein S6 [Planctomycetota bacterium]
MTDKQTNTYEGLFLFPQATAANLQAAVDHLTDLLKRAEAEVISLRKWDERRLAYEIKGNKRGVYFLVYFRADPTRVADLERGCNLSEQLLRSLITRADHIPAEEIEAADGRAQLADEIRLHDSDEGSDRSGRSGSSASGGDQRGGETQGREGERQAQAVGAAPEAATESPEKPAEA